MKPLSKLLCYPTSAIRAALLGRLIANYLPNRATVLDIGCGNMLLAKDLVRRKKITVQGVDVLDMNLTHLPHQLFDGQHLPFPDKSFDVSLLIGVLHHAHNQEALLQEAKRVAKATVIVFEDIYDTTWQKSWVRIRDVLGNVLEEPKMNFALTFHSDQEWEEIFRSHQLLVNKKRLLWNLPKLTKHALYVLKP
ncbi:MAG: class I SAM-dependent methyltransferase [bacterium]|nr:class I SAM-dependent methyltransferase [bacterium]